MAGSRMLPATGQVTVGEAVVFVTALIKARYKQLSVSNGLHSESPLQKRPQCHVQCKSPLPALIVGPRTWPFIEI
jgi:hypothetical protein